MQAIITRVIFLLALPQLLPVSQSYYQARDFHG